MRCNVTTWLWCVYRVRRIFRRDGLMFSQRERFLRELQPFVGPEELHRIAWPHGFFWITPADVKRAYGVLEQSQEKTK